MAGQGEVFIIPPEYYGLGGLGAGLTGAANAAESYIDRNRRRDAEDRQQKLEELETIRQTFGENSEAYRMAAQQLASDMGISTGEKPYVPLEQQQNALLAAAQERIRNGTATEDDYTLANSALYGNALGLPGIRESAETDLSTRKAGLTTAQNQNTITGRQIEDDTTRRNTLASQGQTVGGLQARLDINALEQSDLNLEGQKISNQMGNKQLVTEGLRQENLRQQNARLKQEADDYIKAKETGPYAAQDAAYLAGLAKKLGDAGYVLPSVSFLADGLQGTLPEDQQTQFNEAYQSFADETRQAWLQELNAKAADNSNSAQAIAARNLKAYDDSVKRGAPLEVTEETLRQWTATAMGGTATLDESGFFNKWVLGWQPPTPGVPAGATGTGETIDNTGVQRMVDSMISSLGSPEAAMQKAIEQESAANERTPGLGTAVVNYIRSTYPDAAPEDPEVIANKPPNEEDSVKYQIPSRPAVPKGMVLSADEQDKVTQTIEFWNQRVTRIREKIAKGERPSAADTRGLERARSYLLGLQEQHQENVERVRELNERLTTIENELDQAGRGSSAYTRLNRERNRVLRQLQDIESRIVK